VIEDIPPQILLFAVVEENVPHNGIDPALKVGSILKSVFVLQRFQEGILYQVFCVFYISCKIDRKSTHYRACADQHVIKFNGTHGKNFFLFNNRRQRLNRGLFEPNFCLTKLLKYQTKLQAQI
jgi:hypothetical protein